MGLGCNFARVCACLAGIWESSLARGISFVRGTERTRALCQRVYVFVCICVFVCVWDHMAVFVAVSLPADHCFPPVLA